MSWDPASAMRAWFAAHTTVGHTWAWRAIAAEMRAQGHATDFAMSYGPKLPSVLTPPEALRVGRQLVEALLASDAR